MNGYQTELQKAMSVATYIPQIIQHLIPTFEFIGQVSGPRGNSYYYYDKSEDKYYVEGDIDREMRAAIRRNCRKK